MKNKIFVLGLIFLSLFIVSVTATNQCDIRTMSHNQASIGDFPAILQFQVVSERGEQGDYYNDSLIHATCALNLYSYGKDYDGWAGGNGSIIAVYNPYDSHGIRFTNRLGDVAFTIPVDSYEWQPNTVYAWQVECYCLPNATDGDQDRHNCWYGLDGVKTDYIACSETGNFTTGDGVYFEKTHNFINLWLILASALVLTIAGFAFKDKSISVLSGILLTLFGLVLLRTDIIIEGFTEISQIGFGMAMTLIGVYMILFYAVKRFSKPKEEEDDVIVERDYR